MQMISTSFPYVLGTRYGLPIVSIGLFSAISGVIMIILGAGLIKPLTFKFGEKKLFIFAVVVGIFTNLMYPFMIEAWMLFIFIVPFVFSNIFSRTISQAALSKAVDEDKQGLVAGYSTNVQSIGQIIAPIIAYSFLEVMTFNVFGLTLDAYFFIGITCALSTTILLVLVLIDVKKHPKDFVKAKKK
jgi:Na+/melibiose symporter-like transporter